MDEERLARLRTFYGRIRDDHDLSHSSMFGGGKTGNRMRYVGCEDAVEALRRENAERPNST